MNPSVRNFIETVERSGLVSRKRLKKVLHSLRCEVGREAIRDTHCVSSQLTLRGLLTPWQRTRLLEGRYRGFFLGKYKLLDHLGSGGMGSVFVAKHMVMHRRVAIKVLPVKHGDSLRLRRFHREARAAALIDHPNIVRAYDVDQDGDVHFLVMEYVRGRDLKRLVRQYGPLEPRTAADYIRQAAAGLARAHALGLVHRDIKPANLIVDQQGAVKVLDLGLASISGSADGAISTLCDEKIVGTVDYLAPEQAINSHRVDGRADIYSLGCTLYFLLSGRAPFADNSVAHRLLAHQVRDPVDLRRDRPEVPEELTRICRRMMAKSRSARYQSMEEVHDELAHWLKQPTLDMCLLVRPEDNVRLASQEQDPSASSSASRFKAEHLVC